ncbi:hypothetical protein HDU76_010901 [Blyttiomyces sp. JEL0837]|nr:hypothetical protein HDU76_010901 [Blyttiomyces sp. JEL0837]
MAGFIFGACLTYAILTLAEPGNGYPSRDWVLLIGCVVGGLLVGGIALCLHGLAISLIGSIGGLVLALFILGFNTGGVIQSGWGRFIFILIFMIIGAIIAIKVERWAVIVATSLVGGFGVIYGIDCYAHTGFKDGAALFLGGGSDRFNVVVFEVNSKVIAMSISVLVLAAIGTFVQYRMNIGRNFGDK